MSLIVGDYKNDNPSRSEIRIFSEFDNEPKAIFRDSTFRNLNIENSVSYIPFCRATLIIDCDELSTLFSTGTVIEVWISRSKEGNLINRFRGKIDFIDLQFDQNVDDKASVIEFQARHLAALLMDSPVNLQGKDTLMGLVHQICRRFDIQVDVVSTISEIDYYIDARSAYGVLRLLGLAFNGMVIAESKDSIRYSDTEAVIKELKSKKPLAIITKNDILSAKLTQGNPVRKRS